MARTQVGLGAVALVILGVGVWTLWDDSSGERVGEGSASVGGAEEGGTAASSQLRAPVRTEVPPKGASSTSSGQGNSDAEVLPAVLRMEEDSEFVDQAAKVFLELWPQFVADYEQDVEQKRAGDRMLRLIGGSWGAFDAALAPSAEMFEGLSQSDTYMMASILQDAGAQMSELKRVGPEERSPQELLALRDDYRDQSLYHSPELLIEDRYPGLAWREDPELVQQVRATWTETLRQLARLATEHHLYERCAGKAVYQVAGRLDRITGDLALVAPGLTSNQAMREDLCREYYDRLVDLIHDRQD